jgi:hypothetical protein
VEAMEKPKLSSELTAWRFVVSKLTGKSLV